MLLRSDSESPVQWAIQNQVNALPPGATDCTTSTIHARVARGIWPSKTAENWALAAGVQPRMAKYWLAGTHPVSADGILALIRVLN